MKIALVMLLVLSVVALVYSGIPGECQCLVGVSGCPENYEAKYYADCNVGDVSISCCPK